MPPNNKEVFFSNPNRGAIAPKVDTTLAYVEKNITPIKKEIQVNPGVAPPPPVAPKEVKPVNFPKTEGVGNNFLDTFGKDKKVLIKAEYFDEEPAKRPINLKDFLLETSGNPNEEVFEVDIDERKKNVRTPKPRPVSAPKKTEQKIELDSPEMQIGDYCIFIKNKLIHNSPDVSEIEEMLQYLLFDDQSPIPDLESKDICLLKRLPIKIGVHIL